MNLIIGTVAALALLRCDATAAERAAGVGAHLRQPDGRAIGVFVCHGGGQPPPVKPGRDTDQQPVTAVVVEERPDHRAGEGVVATVLVKVVDGCGRLDFKQGGGRAYLEITRATKVTRRAGSKTGPARPGDLKKGVAVEFDFSGVAQSEPAVISATVVVVVADADPSGGR